MKRLLLSFALILVVLHLGVSLNVLANGSTLNQAQQNPAPQIPVQKEPDSPVKSQDASRSQIQHPPFAAPPINTRQSSYEHEEAKNDRNKGSEDSTEFTHILGHKIKLTDGLMAFFTFILILIGAWQGFQLRKTVATMDDTAQRQLRAYVHVESATIDHGSAQFPQALITIRNAGKTPAYNLTYFSSFALDVEFEEGHKDTFGPGKGIQVVVGPDSTKTLTLREKRKMSHEHVIRVIEGKMTLFVHGEIHYFDAFQMPHTTRFRLKTSLDGINGICLTHCMEGNDAD